MLQQSHSKSLRSLQKLSKQGGTLRSIPQCESPMIMPSKQEQTGKRMFEKSDQALSQSQVLK